MQETLKTDKKELTNEELQKQYMESSQIDRKLFAEQKSNNLLYVGDHYAKQGTRFFNHVRDSRALDQTTKIRITKNHIQKICKGYINNILTYAPDVKCLPNNESELQDQKAAELNESVWNFVKRQNTFDELKEEFVLDFIVTGEVFNKIYFDPKKGEHIAYQAKIDAMGQPVLDENGQPMQGEPVMSGQICMKRLFAYNVLRDPRAQSIRESKYLIYQQLMPLEDVRAMCGGDQDKLKFVQEGTTSEYKAFDSVEGKYVETKGQCLVMEHFYRPTQDMPNGRYIMRTENGILFNVELPFGIWPIAYAGFDELPGTPRHNSLIKILRPYQAEINRAASMAVETQISLGQDKLITDLNAKMTQGVANAGIRHIQVSGERPTYLPGQNGQQHYEWIAKNIEEMYAVANYSEDGEEKNAQMDAYQMLYSSMKDKKKVVKYSRKIERFLRETCEITLKIGKNYLEEDALIPMIGRSERVNISEFKNSDALCFQIKLAAQTEDPESVLGKQLQITNLLQYVGSSLGKEDIGKLTRLMPFVNGEETFSDLTMDYDNATNDILSLDRGNMPPARKYDKHVYHMQRLSTRMSKPDFQNMHPHIKSLYDAKIAEHEQASAVEAQKLQAAEAGFIPSGGVLIPVDVYVQDPSSPTKTQRARVPMEAVMWLMDRLKEQGQSQEQIKSLNPGVTAEMSQYIKPPQNGGSQQGQVDESAPKQPYLYNQGAPQQ